MKQHDTECPMQKTAQLLSDLWTMLLFRELLVAPARFCELERALGGISTRTLTLKLNKLIDEELVTKGEDGVYSLTKKGKGLRPVIAAMRQYGERYL